jgi:exopolysaccharide biosynthesis polyprenyl glycosylphosphotransferase
MIRFLSCWVVPPRSFLLAAEAALTGIIVGFAIWIATRTAGMADVSIGLVIGLAGGQVVLAFTGIERTIVNPDPLRFLRAILGSLLIGVIFTVILFEAVPRFSQGYSGLLLAWLLSVVFAAAVRPLLRWLARRHRLIETTMIYGTDDLAEKLYQELSTGDTVVPSNVSSAGQFQVDSNQEHVSRIVIADPPAAVRGDVAASLLDSKLRGLRIERAVESCEKMCRKIWLAGLQPEWLLCSNGFAPTRICRGVKWCVDTIGAVFVTLLISPLLIVTALAIKLTSPGPVFYRQERVGRFGRTFTVYKFRSMYADAESRTGPTWAVQNDSRITPLGRILRKLRIDELPQVFNVLKGEMSFVGPRPERPYFVESLKKEIPFYDLRHYVRPGITGWAQVMYRYGASVADSYEKLQYDLYYTKHMSVLLDLTILIKTLKVVISAGGR